MKTNLLLLDSFRNIENLIHFAFSFSKRFNHNLKICYVLDFDWVRQSALIGVSSISNVRIVNAEKSLNREYEKAEAKIREVVTNYLKNNSVDFPIDFNVTKNNRIDTINSEFEKNSDLMVLIGNHQNYSEITDGLVSYPKLVEFVKCPILVIPDNTKVADMQNVVYASDFNPEDIRSLKHLSSFMRKSDNTNITILHNESDFNFKEKLQWAGFKDIVQAEVGSSHLNFVLNKAKDFITGIEEFAEESNPDMLVVMKEEKGFFKDIFSTNKTKNVLTHFDKPVLVYHEKQKI